MSTGTWLAGDKYMPPVLPKGEENKMERRKRD
jgi:hypothetical protein